MTILCATDFSPCSLAAADLAATLARRFGDKLLLLHVVEPLTIPPEAPPGADLFPPGMMQAAEMSTARAARELSGGGLTGPAASDGSPGGQRRPLPGHDPRQPVGIGDHRPVDRLVEGEEAGLVSEQLPDG
jgi:hypothetical protein